MDSESEKNEMKRFYNQYFCKGISVKVIDVSSNDDSIIISDLDHSNIWIVSIMLANKLLAKNVNRIQRLKYLQSIREDFLKQQSQKITRFYDIGGELLTVENFWEFITERPQTSRKEIVAPFISSQKRSPVRVISKKTSAASSSSLLPSSSTITTKAIREQLRKRPLNRRILSFKEKRPKILYKETDSTDDEEWCSQCNSSVEEQDTSDDQSESDEDNQNNFFSSKKGRQAVEAMKYLDYNI